MKIRCGFVSNSSDASFVIPLDRLTPLQIEAIKRHCALGEIIGIPCPNDPIELTFQRKSQRFFDGELPDFSKHVLENWKHGTQTLITGF